MRDSMLKEFGHFNPELIRIISYVAIASVWESRAQVPCSLSSHVKCWPLYFHEPLPRWSKGRIILIGDAAHPVCQSLTMRLAEQS